MHHIQALPRQNLYLTVNVLPSHVFLSPIQCNISCSRRWCKDFVALSMCRLHCVCLGGTIPPPMGQKSCCHSPPWYFLEQPSCYIGQYTRAGPCGTHLLCDGRKVLWSKPNMCLPWITKRTSCHLYIKCSFGQVGNDTFGHSILQNFKTNNVNIGNAWDLKRVCHSSPDTSYYVDSL